MKWSIPQSRPYASRSPESTEFGVLVGVVGRDGSLGSQLDVGTDEWTVSRLRPAGLGICGPPDLSAATTVTW